MVFEIGKYYEHTTGSQIYICGDVNDKSIIYNNGLIGINGLSDNFILKSSIRYTAIQNPSPLIIVGKTEYFTTNYKEIEYIDFRSLLKLNTSTILNNDNFKIGGFYKGVDDASIHIFSEIKINDIILKVFESNGSNVIGVNKFIEHDLDILTVKFNGFTKISKSEFNLLNYIYANQDQKKLLIRDMKINKLMLNE